ncbi:hypothetical protein SNE510_30300 [Streptomyces sp. NE5-10]|uniref:hypothetical protein n=1 Tax=Streptomyces sp. NE5-10 TaxID=2759674 RepID=UPI00190769B6|nr:hypothetical protein [Streptomyces sp. NE5-10]GHJ93511.1 hypothetical protein SNE510_30300 [Streptomyces sp. NE5-10]
MRVRPACPRAGSRPLGYRAEVAGTEIAEALVAGPAALADSTRRRSQSYYWLAA